VPQTFITLKTPSLLTGFEPMNLGSNGKYDNHYTTENDYIWVNTVRYVKTIWSEDDTIMPKHETAVFLNITPEYFSLCCDCQKIQERLLNNKMVC
jgi:hypothetical protein